MAPGELAAKWAEENPDLSNRLLADIIGISRETVRRRRKSTGTNVPVETTTRIGADGKQRVLPSQPDAPAEETRQDFLSPSDADEAVAMIAKHIYHGLLYPGPGILACLKEAMGRASVEDQKAIVAAAECLSELARCVK